MSGADVALGGQSETNKMEFKRKAGQPVTYGSIVQLKHFASRQYLTQTKNRAEVEPPHLLVLRLCYVVTGTDT